MAALQCEICGGKLVGKPGGIFECEYCGMQYDKTRIQEMVQEIKGTVKVEGTVQVAGTVKVEGTATKNSLLKRAFLEYEAGNAEEAIETFEKVLDIDPECGDAYWGKLLAEFEQYDEEELLNCTEEDLRSSTTYRMVLRFGNEKQKKALSAWEHNYEAHLAQQVAIELARKQAEEAKHREEEKTRKERMALVEPLLENRRAEVLPAKYALRANQMGVYFLMPDGRIRTIYTEDTTPASYSSEVSRLKNIAKYELIKRSILIQDIFGNAYIMQYNDSPKESYGVEVEFKKKELVSDHSVVDICCTSDHVYVLKTDGVLECWAIKTSHSSKYATDYVTRLQTNFTQIAKIAGTKECLYAINNDGVWQKLNKENQWEQLPADTKNVFGYDRLSRDGLVTAFKVSRFSDQLEKMTEKDGWTEVIDFQHNYGKYVALRMDGTVKINGKFSKEQEAQVSKWENVAAVVLTDYVLCELFAITKSGKVLSTQKHFAQKKPLFTNLAELKQAQQTYFENAKAMRNAEIERKIQRKKERIEKKKQLGAQKAQLTEELANLKGFFTGKRRREIEARLAEIETELKGL